MAKHGKKYNNAVKTVKRETLPVLDALKKIKELAYVKFDESVDVDINLGIDPSKGEQVVRGSVVLPNSKGKAVRVLVFAKGDAAEEAKKAGADFIGDQELVDKILSGWMDFDHALATPEMMSAVGKVAKILGPRGLLPNKKLGTVTDNIAQAVHDLKKGQAFFRNDKAGLVHFSFGKVSFDVNKLHENLAVFIKALQAVKPATAKGKYIKKVTLSSSMGVGVSVNPEELLQA